MAATTYRDFTVEHAGREVTVHLIEEHGHGVTVEVEMGAGMDFARRDGERVTLDDLTADMDDALFG